MKYFYFLVLFLGLIKIVHSQSTYTLIADGVEICSFSTKSIDSADLKAFRILKPSKKDLKIYSSASSYKTFLGTIKYEVDKEKYLENLKIAERIIDTVIPITVLYQKIRCSKQDKSFINHNRYYSIKKKMTWKFNFDNSIPICFDSIEKLIVWYELFSQDVNSKLNHDGVSFTFGKEAYYSIVFEYFKNN